MEYMRKSVVMPGNHMIDGGVQGRITIHIPIPTTSHEQSCSANTTFAQVGAVPSVMNHGDARHFRPYG